MASTRRLIEDAVILALKDLQERRIVRSIRTFSGPLTEDLDDAKRLTGGQFPAILVTTGRADYQALQTQRRRHTKNLALHIFVFSPSLRSREEARRDDVGGGSAGVYLLMEYISEALEGMDPVLPGVGRIEPVSEEEFASQPDVNVWRMSFDVPVDVGRPRDGTLSALLEIMATVEDAEHTPVATARVVVGENQGEN